MKIILLGTGAARPDAKRAPPSQVVIVNGEPLLIDCGGGTGTRLMKVGINPVEINHIFLTHLHVDHCVDYPSIILGSYLLGRKKEIYVHGPEGTKDFSDNLFKRVYSYIPSLIRRLKQVEMKLFINEVYEGLVFQTDAWKATATQVRHGTIKTLAYRIDAKDGSIVISSDTEPCPNLIKLAKNADVLVHECSFPDFVGEKPGHTIPRQLGEIAKASKVKKVILTHLFPPCNGHESEMVKSVKKNFDGEVIVGEDLMEIRL